MKNLWKGIAILGIWGSIPTIAYFVTSPTVVGVAIICAVFATAIVAETNS